MVGMDAEKNANVPDDRIKTLLRKVPTGINVRTDRFGHDHLLSPDLTPGTDTLKLVKTVENPKGGSRSNKVG